MGGLYKAYRDYRHDGSRLPGATDEPERGTGLR